MKHIATIEKNSVEEIHVDLHEWKSEVYVDVRVWYRVEPGADGDVHATRKGLRFNAELLPELRSAIDVAIQAIEDGERIDEKKGKAVSLENGSPEAKDGEIHEEAEEEENA